MDSLICSAKSGNNCTGNELRAYNIQTQCKDSDLATFFGDPVFSLPEVDEEILTTLELKDMLSAPNAKLIRLLDRAMIPAPDREESAVHFCVNGRRDQEFITKVRYPRMSESAHERRCVDAQRIETAVPFSSHGLH